MFLSLLTTLKDAFRVNGGSEAATCQVITYYLEGDAKDVYETELMYKYYDAGACNCRPHFINALLSRFLTVPWFSKEPTTPF